MRNAFFLLLFFLSSFSAYSQTAAFRSTYVFFNVEGNQKSYMLNNNPTDFVTPNFDGNNLGVFSSASIFQLKGAEHNVEKCGGCNISATHFNYRIYKIGDTPGSFIPKNIGYSSGGMNACGGEDQQWRDISGADNLLTGLTAGNYTIEVYSDATISCGTGTMYASNGGANYKATFTYATDFTWNGSADTTWINPANWTPNAVPGATDNVTVTGTAVPNKLNIISDRSINDFILAGSDATSFSLASGKTFTINGNLGYTGTASAILDCNSSFSITNAASQTIPPLTYGNLDILGGPRILYPSGIIKICSEFKADPTLYAYTVAGSTVEYISTAATKWNMNPFTYNNLIFSGTSTFSMGKSFDSNPQTKIFDVLGNFTQSAGTVYLGDHPYVAGIATLNIDGDMNINGGIFDMNKKDPTYFGETVSLNLKGDLYVSNSAELYASWNGIFYTNFNLIGIGDGLSAATTQTIDIANQLSASNITFNVNSGAFARLINQNLALGTNSAFNVKTGGKLDFGYSGNTALNIIRAGSQIGQSFTSDAGSTLKITSPDGITNIASVGNVQTPTSSRNFNEDATFYLIGKANLTQVAANGVDQVTGNAFPSSTIATTSQKIIVDLATTNIAEDDVSVKSLGLTKLNSSGFLQIIKGKVVDESGNGFEHNSGQNANLTMSGGRYTISRGATQPSLGGTYNLSGGVIEFAGNSAINIRTSRNYLNVEVSGTNVSTGSPTAGVTLLNGGKFTVKDNGIFKVANANGFSGLTTTAVRSTNNPSIYLEPLSTIEYNNTGNQIISKAPLASPTDGNYQSLKISGTGVKTATGITIIKNYTTITSAELLVSSTADNAIPNEFRATNGITVNPGAVFRLANNANLLQDAAATNTGNIIAERNLNFSLARKEYNYLISPVQNLNLTTIYKNFLGNPVTVPAVLYHSEATNKFYNSTGAYIAGRALAVKEAATADFATPTMTANFTGVPMNGAFSYTLVNSAPANPDRGYNLIGNPYPSNIDLLIFYANNSTNLSSTFNFWDNKANTRTAQEGDGYDGKAYAQFNAATPPGIGTGTIAVGDSGTNSLKKPTKYVKIGQGFMAKSLVSNFSANFDNTIRTAGISEGFFGKNSLPFDRYWINMISPTNIVSQIAVVYFVGGTDGFTKDDSTSLLSSDAIYSLVEDEKLAINGKNSFTDTDVVPLGSKHFAAGDYTISLEEKEGVFANGQNIYLQDKLTGTITNLSEGNFTFSANAGEIAGRFAIIYNPEITLATDAATKENIIIYKNGSNFVIKSKSEKITDLQVFETSGKLIFQTKPNAKEFILNAEFLLRGVFVLKINRGGKMTTKKVIR